MKSNTLTYSGYAIYYEEHKAYLDHTGRHYDMICEDCIWQDGHFIPQALAKAVRWVRKVFGGNIYVVRVEIKCKKANRHGILDFEPTMSYERFKEIYDELNATQSRIEIGIFKTKDQIKSLNDFLRTGLITTKSHTNEIRTAKTYLIHARRYLQETFYNKPKKEVNDGRE